jgi:hypothetical protein
LGACSARGAELAFAESTARIGVSRLTGGFRMHDPAPEDVDAALAPGGFLEGLRALRAAGKIGQVSLGMNANKPEVKACILRLVREAPPETFNSALLAGGWNLLCQDSLEIMQEAQQVRMVSLVGSTD